MSLYKVIGTVTLLTMAVSAQNRPGIDRPIRVGIFKGMGQNRPWHTNIHTAGSSIAAFLSNPSAGGLGPNLIIPEKGFSFTEFGLPIGMGTPTAAQVSTFISALDSLDVALIGSFVDLGTAIPDAIQRQTLANFWATKGFVSLHHTTDTYGSWPPLDTLQGTRCQNHPSSDRNATIRRDTLAKNDPSWVFLNSGLADTTFLEEWLSFTTNGNVIRAVPYLKVLMNMDEASYAGGLGGARAMGDDHPMSWYRELPTGGRFFYTAVGHRANLYQGGLQPRFLRRQIYNGILWASKYPATTSIHNAKAPGDASRYSRLTFAGSSLTVSPTQPGLHSVELLTLSGKRVALQTGLGQASHTFTNLTPNSMYVVAVSTPVGRAIRLVTMH